MKKNLKIKKLNKINDHEVNQIIKLLLDENSNSILASLKKNIIKKYLQKIVMSKDITIYVTIYKKRIIAYAIIAKKISKLISIISNMKIQICFYLIIQFKFLRLLNIIFSYIKLDMILLQDNYKKIINSNYNLNLLAVEKKFQSQGIGSFFLKKIFKLIKKANYITVETIDNRAAIFYKKRHNFKLMGNKLRFPKKLKVLYKKIT